MAALTDIQIFNLALQRLGVTSGLVTAVDGTDTTFWGKQAFPLYQQIRDEELRSGDWDSLISRDTLVQAQYIDSAASWTNGSTSMVVTDSSKLTVGWLPTVQSAAGLPNQVPPTGIPTDTYIAAIVDGTHVTLSAAATQSGSGQVTFTAKNKTGYWFVFEAPSDILILLDVYSVFPASFWQWPFKIRHQLRYQAIYEGTYIYTDNYDNTAGNPIAMYIGQPALGSPAFNADFISVLKLRLASNLATAGNGFDPTLKQQIDQEYILLRDRALGNSRGEHELLYEGEEWWRG